MVLVQVFAANGLFLAGMVPNEIYMQRCIQLAQQAAGWVAPNPMVGAVLVYQNSIIGEGYHEKFGQAHAEVNCLNAVAEEDRHLIHESDLFVSLEPCAHHGKTPPCADLIIQNKIPRVIIGCRDPFPLVNGKGIEKLQAAGVEVHVGLLEDECRKLNKRFFQVYQKPRPYIVLKWAQTRDGKIAHGDYNRAMISGPLTNRLVHKWRSEEAAILVGTNTALHDNPSLTVRDWEGAQPIRLVVDMQLRLPENLHLLDKHWKTIVFNGQKHAEKDQLSWYQLATDTELVHQLEMALYQLKIQSVLVEGGAKLLQSFIDESDWDEARIITNEKMDLPDGIPAPVLHNQEMVEEFSLDGDRIQVFRNKIS